MNWVTSHVLPASYWLSCPGLSGLCSNRVYVVCTMQLRFLVWGSSDTVQKILRINHKASCQSRCLQTETGSLQDATSFFLASPRKVYVRKYRYCLYHGRVCYCHSGPVFPKRFFWRTPFVFEKQPRILVLVHVNLECPDVRYTESNVYISELILDSCKYYTPVA
jgi:hypothetical protein